MENVRIFYKKQDRMKFISHLDMTRFMIRMLRKAEIPVWYTEGFNKHPYINFALPLSLGFESNKEVMDFKITEEITAEEIFNRLISVFPSGIELIKVSEPKLKPKEIKYAEYFVLFEEDVVCSLTEFLASNEIKVIKKGKKGKETEIDLKPHIIKNEITFNNGNTFLKLVLPAGSELNINPSLLINAFLKDREIINFVTRNDLLTKDFNSFE